MYQLLSMPFRGFKRLSDGLEIQFPPVDDRFNTDYVTFKFDVANGAELLDVDGNIVDEEKRKAILYSLV